MLMTFIDVGIVSKQKITNETSQIQSPHAYFLKLANWNINHSGVLRCFIQTLYKIKTGIYKIEI